MFCVYCAARMAERSSGEYQCEGGALISRELARRLRDFISSETPVGGIPSSDGATSDWFCPRCGLREVAIGRINVCPGCLGDVTPFCYELLELNPHLPAGRVPDQVQLAIEFHDSSLVEVSASKLLLCAYVHRWIRFGADWSGSGWKQDFAIRLNREDAGISERLPLVLAGGTMSVAGSSYDNVLPYPFGGRGLARIVLEDETGTVHEFQGLLGPIQARGEARFVERLPEAFAPNAAG